MQVSWAPDIEIHAPITLTAPSNNWVRKWLISPEIFYVEINLSKSLQEAVNVFFPSSI
jgi:hypothetical protein